LSSGNSGEVFNLAILGEFHNNFPWIELNMKVRVSGGEHNIKIYMPKRPVVIAGLCKGCEACVSLCPEVFEMGDDGKAHVRNPDACNACDCEGAVNICPTEAISWEEG
jgi:ferredoxin